MRWNDKRKSLRPWLKLEPGEEHTFKIISEIEEIRVDGETREVFFVEKKNPDESVTEYIVGLNFALSIALSGIEAEKGDTCKVKRAGVGKKTTFEAELVTPF